MSELVLYVVATIVVLAGVAYFFVKQREQEALSQRRPQRAKQTKAKKETKEPKEPRENKIRKPHTRKEAEVAPTSSKKKKEEDETKTVLKFLEGKKFSSEKNETTAQAKVRSAPPKVEKAAPAPKKAAAVQSDSDSGSDNEEYEKVTRKIKTNNTKDKPEEDATEEKPQKQKKKAKFFTKQEEEEHKAAIQKKKDDYEARKNRPKGERRPRPVEGEEGFEAVKQRRPRKERAEGEPNGDNEESEGRRKYPAREPDQPPVFANEYETADMDHILNSLTSYYNNNPEAGRKQKPAKRQPAAEAESSKAESDD